VTNRALPIVAGALLVGGTAALVWQTSTIQRAALAVGNWCAPNAHMMLCSTLTGVAANLVTMQLGKGRVLLRPVAKMCSANPQSCFWLGSIISFVAVDSNSKSDTIIISNDFIKNSPNNFYHWEITKNNGALGLLSCEKNPDTCTTYNNRYLVPSDLQKSLLNSSNIGH